MKNFRSVSPLDVVYDKHKNEYVLIDFIYSDGMVTIVGRNMPLHHHSRYRTLNKKEQNLFDVTLKRIAVCSK